MQYPTHRVLFRLCSTHHTLPEGHFDQYLLQGEEAEWRNKKGTLSKQYY